MLVEIAINPNPILWYPSIRVILQIGDDASRLPFVCALYLKIKHLMIQLEYGCRKD